MRRLILLVVLPLLLMSRPVFASTIFNNDQDDSEHQQAQYGQFFGIVLGGAGALVALLVVYGIMRGIRAEHSRGKKKSAFREEILDKTPRKKETLFAGERVPDWKIDNRVKATRAALKFLASTDVVFSRKRMITVAANVFIKIKEALEARIPKTITGVVTKDCLEGLIADIRSLREDHKRHMFGRLEVTEVDIVHIEAPVGKKNHSFTALITAKSKDYFEDEKTGKLLKGTKKTAYYQEFWRFRRSKDRWLLDRMRPAGDMDRILEVKNVMAQEDLQEFAKDTDEANLREIEGK